ncbi:hypothetical protein [Candidatus Sororendozoicomonas aggregata]|uniref:hypothetical protein n=1 Tax=Candidatus Sororendozoicomonas aggregata TaxID=3073239 RepID=UPI002ED0817B
MAGTRGPAHSHDGSALDYMTKKMLYKTINTPAVVDFRGVIRGFWRKISTA